MQSISPIGSVAAIPTPLLLNGTVDQSALARVILHVIEGGCSGILVLGSSGEVATLTTSNRKDVIRTAIDVVSKRCDLFVGIASPNLEGALDSLSSLGAEPVDAALVVPPYFGSLNQVEVEGFYRTLHESSAIPILGYNIPSYTGIRIEVSTATRLANDGVLVGIKDSSRDLEYFQQIALIAPSNGNSWMSYIGTDSLLLPAMMLGAKGGITLSASIAPTWTSELIRAVAARKYDEAIELQMKLTAMILALRRGTFPAGAKAALSLLGFGTSELAPPARGLSPTEIRELGKNLMQIGVPGFENLGGDL